MPLPHFLLLILAVILAAGLTIWAANAVGIPLAALGLLALVGAAATLTVHVRGRRLGWGNAFWFLASWLTGELALFHLVF